MKNTTSKNQNPILKKIKANILREKISSRGGGVEISLTKFGYPDELLSAYQNYLGGGILGSIGNSSTLTNWEQHEDLKEVAKELCNYLHSKTNPDGEFEGMTYEDRQLLPISAY